MVMVMGEKEYIAPTWNNIYEMCIFLAKKIKKSLFKPAVIVGIARGGWIPARILSDLLDNPYTANIKIEFYKGIKETEETPILTQPLSTEVANKKVLVVDDVADSGKSLLVAKRHVINKKASNVKIATLFYKPWSIIIPDYYVKETSAWIIFPWEVRETIFKIASKLLNEGKSYPEINNELLKTGLKKPIINLFLKDFKLEIKRKEE